MDAMPEAGVWALPERVALDTVAALFRERAGQAASVRAFDLSRVRVLDSAGVALLHWMRLRQVALGLEPAPVRGDGGRYLRLCQAHRLDDVAGCAA